MVRERCYHNAIPLLFNEWSYNEWSYRCNGDVLKSMATFFSLLLYMYVYTYITVNVKLPFTLSMQNLIQNTVTF